MRSSLLIVCGLLSGCALLGKSEPLDVRYFELVEPPPQGAPAPASSGSAQPLRLRLSTVRAARHLTEDLLTRESETELSYAQDLRWTELPAEFVRRSLERSLFEQAGYMRVLSGVATNLEVEVTAFERIAKESRARVEVRVHLHDDRVQLRQLTVREEEPLASDSDAQQLAVALGKALDRVSTRVAQVTGEVLTAEAAKQSASEAAQAPMRSQANPGVSALPAAP